MIALVNCGEHPNTWDSVSSLLWTRVIQQFKQVVQVLRLWNRKLKSELYFQICIETSLQSLLCARQDSKSFMTLILTNLREEVLSLHLSSRSHNSREAEVQFEPWVCLELVCYYCYAAFLLEASKYVFCIQPEALPWAMDGRLETIICYSKWQIFIWEGEQMEREAVRRVWKTFVDLWLSRGSSWNIGSHHRPRVGAGKSSESCWAINHILLLF